MKKMAKKFISRFRYRVLVNFSSAYRTETLALPCKGPQFCQTGSKGSLLSDHPMHGRQHRYGSCLCTQGGNSDAIASQSAVIRLNSPQTDVQQQNHRAELITPLSRR